jgi:cytochrome c-type biogenesis protein CcmE
VARKRSPARLVIALSVAAVLSVFLLYTSIAGGGTPSLQPGQLKGRTGHVTLGGVVVSQAGDARNSTGLRFTLKDRKGSTVVPVVYHGTVPDMFREGREVAVQGTLRNGVFVAQRDTLVTKCPSKYIDKKS